MKFATWEQSLTGPDAVWYLLPPVAQLVIDHGAALCLRLPVFGKYV